MLHTQLERRRPSSTTTLLILLTIFAGTAPNARGQAFRTESGLVVFTSSVPLHNFDGKSDHLVGRISLSDSTIDFYVDLATLETGIGKRDRDMRKTLETDEYPFAEFYGKLVSPFDAAADTAQPVKVVGDFSIHGVTRTIEVSGTLEPNGQALTVTGTWLLNMGDYKIDPPSLLMMTVDKVQRIRIEAQLEPEAAQKS
jgi:polyisoprenoid-binding protein YceI